MSAGLEYQELWVGQAWSSVGVLKHQIKWIGKLISAHWRTGWTKKQAFMYEQFASYWLHNSNGVPMFSSYQAMWSAVLLATLS